MDDVTARPDPPPYPPARPPAARPPAAPPPGLDPALRVAGGVLALVGGFLVGVLAVQLIPLRVGYLLPGAMAESVGVGVTSLRLPIVVLIVLVVNAYLPWFAARATGLRWAALLPHAGWFLVVALALGARAEGDRLLLQDDWVAAVTMFTGTAALVIATALAVSRHPRQPLGAPADPG